ncbi:hypothetical protein ACWGOQ_0007695 [Aquimarina sp. M1]
MKTIIIILCMIFTMPMINAQTNATSKVTVKYSNNDASENGYRINISISNTNDTYTLNAKFPSHKTEEVKRFLNDHLDTKFSKNYGAYTWNYHNTGKEVYTVKLRKGKLSIFLNKEYASIDLVEDLLDVFGDLRDLIKKES